MTDTTTTFDRYAYHREVFETARYPERGKPFEHNVRLFGGDDEIRLRYHATIVITFKSDGTMILANGGWNTITTLQKIRAHAGARLWSVKGDWYLRLQPNPKDPQPDRFERTIPKPYTAEDPGPEPVKSADGCIAGTTEEYSYVVGEYDWHNGPKVERNVGQYPGIYGDWIVWHNGLIAYGESGYRYGEKIPASADYKQCPHCKAFEVEHEAWRMQAYGPRWGRRFDQQRGYVKYAEMMERFSSMEAWQEAYIEDFRARKAYLKADRDWDQRNRVAFYDGVVIDSDGYALRLRATGPSPAKLRRHEAAVERMKKRIDNYVAGYIEQLRKGMPMPSGADCWMCAGIIPRDDHDHLHSHITTRERYYVPSLAVNALREAGYRDVGIYMWLDMDPDNNRMGKQDGSYDSVKRDIRKYLRKRLIPKPPTF